MKVKGLASYFVIFSMIVLVAVSVASFLYFRPLGANSIGSEKTNSTTQTTPNFENAGSGSFQNSNCKGNGTVNLSTSPMRFEDIGLIIPMGAMAGGHVT